jgi:hypothetical protein
MRGLYAAKRLIEDKLCEELRLTQVKVPLIIDRESGVNDYLDRVGSRTPVAFHIGNDREQNPIDAEVVHGVRLEAGAPHAPRLHRRGGDRRRRAAGAGVRPARSVRARTGDHGGER